MSEQQMAEFYERLVQGKNTEVSLHYPFQRGWNAGIEFAIKQMRLTCDEIEETKEAAE